MLFTSDISREVKRSFSEPVPHNEQNKCEYMYTYKSEGEIRACEYGMLRHVGSKRRGDLYQSDVLIELLEEISSEPGIRRVLAR